MIYENAIIYYWSGTGNTLRIAKWVNEFLKNKVNNISITSITEADPGKQIKPGKDTLLLIASPTHGFTMPWAVIKFCLHLPIRRKTHAITIANGAGYSYFGLLLPGITGSTNLLISLILFLKGYRIKGCVSIDMPGSWPAICPSLSKEHINFFLKQAKTKTEKFIKIITSGKKYFFNIRNFAELIFGLASIPISFGYLIYGRLFLAKLQFANLNCNSCGICAENCSHKAIIMKGKLKFKKPYWTFKCESCGRCISYCPRNAIETGHSMAILIWYVATLSASYHVFDRLFKSTIFTSFMANAYIIKLFNYVSFVCSVFLCYFILYYLVKIPFINKIFTYTSGTHWWSKYHEPSVKLRDFKSTHLAVPSLFTEEKKVSSGKI